MFVCTCMWVLLCMQEEQESTSVSLAGSKIVWFLLHCMTLFSHDSYWGIEWRCSYFLGGGRRWWGVERDLFIRKNIVWFRAPSDATVCASLTHKNWNSPPSSLSCVWNWPNLASEGWVYFLKLCNVRQPEKVGTVFPSSDTGTTHVTLVKMPCCQLSCTPYVFIHCDLLVLKIIILWEAVCITLTVKIQILHSK